MGAEEQQKQKDLELAKLADLREEIGEAQRDLRDLINERNQAVIAATDHGATATEIIQWSGLSRRAIHRVREVGQTW